MTGRSYTCRGFLALSSVAVTGLGLTACTGASLSSGGAAELLGGSGPDIWRIWGGQIGAPFAKAKQAADLAPYYQKYGWDSSINIAAMEGMTFDGVKSGVPFTARGLGAWYNKELLAKAGVTAPPTTYAELEEMNGKLVAAGATDSVIGLIGPYLAFGIPFEVLVLQSFFRQLPNEIVEAARVDGAGDWRIFWRIVLPLSAPALVTVAILDAVATWNEFLFALILLNSDANNTLPVGLLNVQASSPTTTPAWPRGS